MLSRLTLVTSLTVLSTISLFTQDVEAQRFRFRNSYRSCPQQVRYVPPSCATIRYAVPGQAQMVVPAPASMSNSRAIAPGPVENAIQPGAVTEVQPATSERATQTSNPVAPVPVSEPGLIPPANLQPVPTGDTEIVPETTTPPALEPPAAEPPKVENSKPVNDVLPEPAEVEAPKAVPTTSGAKSILDSGK